MAFLCCKQATFLAEGWARLLGIWMVAGHFNCGRLARPSIEVFPPIWNLADAAISVSVIWMLLNQRSYFP